MNISFHGYLIVTTFTGRTFITKNGFHICDAADLDAAKHIILRDLV